MEVKDWHWQAVWKSSVGSHHPSDIPMGRTNKARAASGRPVSLVPRGLLGRLLAVELSLVEKGWLRAHAYLPCGLWWDRNFVYSAIVSEKDLAIRKLSLRLENKREKKHFN